MNLRRIANGLTSRVNRNIPATLVRSTGGYTTNADGTRVPYTENVPVRAQVQGVSAKDLQHLDGLNIQGVMRSVHLSGDVEGAVRVDQRGGDILLFSETPGSAPQSWKIAMVMETWADWCRVIVVLQA